MLKSALRLRGLWIGLVIIAILAGYWLLPISGKVVLLTERDAVWPAPHFSLEPTTAGPGAQVTAVVTDIEPWTFVMLTVNGAPAISLGQGVRVGETWVWRWRFTAPDSPGYVLAFYYDCHLGCVERGRIAVGGASPQPVMPLVPTKLGLVMPNPSRDWHGRSGWAVEITYARQSGADFWGVDDLAARVAAHQAQGLRVMVRVDLDLQQSLPADGDYLALVEYLDYLRRLARDARLASVYGYIIGADFNTREANQQAEGRPITPAWYARLFSGYGEEVHRSDNVIQTVRAVNPTVRLIVGPVRPWTEDAAGELPYTPNVPWLTYMYAMVTYLDESARLKSEAGLALSAPDGFDIQAPGSPDAPEMVGALRADEPRMDLGRESWDGAQVGFRIYRDWMDIINAFPSTRGKPVYIISTNTYDRQAGIPPAQNYPTGWLTAALEVVNAEPQVEVLCWFLDDFPHSDQWDWFSLTRQPGRLVDAAREFEALLRER